MSTPYSPYTPAPASPNMLKSNSSSTPSTPTPSGRGRPRGSMTGTGAKRGRKPRGAAPMGATPSRSTTENTPIVSSPLVPQQYPRVQWAMPKAAGSPAPSTSGEGAAGTDGNLQERAAAAVQLGQLNQVSGESTAGAPGTPVAMHLNFASSGAVNEQTASSSIDVTGIVGMNGSQVLVPVRPHGIEEDVEVDDELLPAMADDDYSAQLSWQSQSKDNLKVLMDNFSPAQYDRFEAYRRHALPKQAVRKVIQHTLGQQVSQPVAQVIAGFSKVFVGEIVEKARAVQTRRGETGPLSPDHLREAYRAYQEETGRVGAARPLKAKRYFVR